MTSQNEDKLKEIFQRYGGNLDELLSSSQSHAERTFQSRVLLGITNSQPTTSLVSSELYQQVSEIKNLSNWVIESLSPFPLISTPVEDDVRERIEQIINWLITGQKHLRAVIAVGTVEFGILGSNSFSSYGSSGDVISSIIRSSVLLETGTCWVTRQVLDFTHREVEESVHVSGIQLYKLI